MHNIYVLYIVYVSDYPVRSASEKIFREGFGYEYSEYSSNVLEQQYNIVQQSVFLKLESLNKEKFKVAYFFCWSRRNAMTSLPRGEDYEGSKQEISGNEDEDGGFFPIFQSFENNKQWWGLPCQKLAPENWKIALLLGWHLYIRIIIYNIIFSGAMLVRLVFFTCCRNCRPVAKSIG